MVLLAISFVAGILTVLAPCVLPLLPVIVGGTVAGERNYRRAITISVALGISVLLSTLLLKASTLFINVPESVWLWISGTVLILFGIVMLFPRLWDSLPFVNTLNRDSNKLLARGYQQNSFWGDVVMGAALGPVFSSCSPTYFVILATVLPASFAFGFIDLLAYVIGLSGFLLVIALLGQRLVDRLGVTIEPHGWFRRGMGVLFILIGILIVTGVEKKIESWLLVKGFDATRLEQRLLGAPTSAAPATGKFLAPEMKAAVYEKAPELVAPDGYINTPRLPSGQAGPITIGEFKGKKVVLIDIWTYSCINCQRTLPYIKAWYDKYKDEGLEIIGVHTPEFAFEKLQPNVQKAVDGFGIKYPVILDNEYRTWNAFGNQFWPRKYLIDIDGYIVYDHAGEGNYDETESAIQRALSERSTRLGLGESIDADMSNPEGVVAVGGRVGSPEVYFGAARNEYFGNGARFINGTQELTLPEKAYPNVLYLGGTWGLTEEYAVNTKPNAQIVFNYSAKNVYFVGSAETPVTIKVTRDGKPLESERGADVATDGTALIGQDRLYHLIQGDNYGVHTIKIEIQGAGLKAYTFTFG